VYLIDEVRSSRFDLLRTMAELGLETWPFTSPDEFLAMLPRLAPSCILLAADMSDEDSLRVIDELVQRTEQWPLIVVAAGGETRTAVDAMKRGAVDYLQRPIGPDRLGAAIEAAGHALDQLGEARSARRTVVERLAKLTPRERDVGRALLSGMGNKTAAHHLGVSVRTVEMHRARILRKLGARTIAEGAAMLALAELPPAGRSRSGPFAGLTSVGGGGQMRPPS
jgi:two-component system response regulator FixJ